MSEYQQALEAARTLTSLPTATVRRLMNRELSTELYDMPELLQDARAVARMLLKNHALSHGEKWPEQSAR